MNSPEESSAQKPSELNAFELLEKLFTEFVIAHSLHLETAATYFGKGVGALREMRIEYQIPKPPPHHYEGPVLSQEEMFRAFLTSLAAGSAPAPVTLELVARSVNVTLAPPGGPIVNVPLSAVLPRATG